MTVTEQHILERGNPDEAHDLAKAQEVLQTLCQHYPGHLWQVSFQGRVLVVRHSLISMAVRQHLSRDGLGFVLKHLDSYSASELAHNAMLAGGEMLEAFGYKRGSWDGSDPVIPSTFKRQRPETFN
jgi:hypothetical protein